MISLKKKKKSKKKKAIDFYLFAVIYGSVYTNIERGVLSNILTYFQRLCTFLEPCVCRKELVSFFFFFFFFL